MEIRSMNMDVVAEDGSRYGIRVGQTPGSKELELTLFSGFSGSVQMHVDSVPAARFLTEYDTRRLLNERTGVLLTVEGFGIVKSWVRMIWDMTR